MNGPTVETMPWGAFLAALWPLWLAYAVLVALTLAPRVHALRGRSSGRTS